MPTDCLGINAKMSEVSAAMGITSIESRSDFVDANKRNHQAYKLGLCEVAGTRLLGYDAQGSNNYQYIVVEIDSGIAGVTRDQIVEVLYWENIFARRYFYPGCHRLEPYKSNSLYRDIKLPCTDALGDSILCCQPAPRLQRLIFCVFAILCAWQWITSLLKPLSNWPLWLLAATALHQPRQECGGDDRGVERAVSGRGRHCGHRGSLWPHGGRS